MQQATRRRKSFTGLFREKWNHLESMIGGIKDGEVLLEKEEKVERVRSFKNNGTDQAFWQRTMASIDVLYIWNEKLVFGKQLDNDNYTILCIMPVKTGKTTISTQSGNKSTKCLLDISNDQISISMAITNTMYKFDYTIEDYGQTNIKKNELINKEERSVAKMF